MDTNEIIAQIDAEIARLQQAKSLLSGTTITATRGPYKAAAIHMPVIIKRTMSPEGRARIAAAQKKRWAKAKKTNQLTNRARSGGGANSGRSQHDPFVVKQHPATQNIAAKRAMSAEGRAKIAAAQKVRWAKAKKAAKKAA
jgi:hypothetical protein